MLLIAQWDNCRVPLAFRLVQPKKSQGYRSENALFREMLKELVLPAWCQMVIVVADAAYASRKNLKAIQAREWFFVIAFPRTWKRANGQYRIALISCSLFVKTPLVIARGGVAECASSTTIAF